MKRAIYGILALGLCAGSALWAVAETSKKAEKREMAQEVIPLWKGTAPGEKGDIEAERDMTAPDPKVKPEDYIIRLGNVTQPTLTVYRPEKKNDNGTAVVVSPGGGYHILALNLEGSEVCKRLNAMGVTAFLLKYRVPMRKGLEKHTAALQDAQRAIGIVRSRAKEWGVNPNRIGLLGFSAGGHLTAMASTNYETRTYPAVDDADKASCRPDFSVLIYPAYLTQEKDMTQLASELKVNGQTPPAFIAMTQDDPVHVENALVYAAALQKAKVSAELHVYPKGGHGYGLRVSPNPVSRWHDRLEEWLHAEGWLK